MTDYEQIENYLQGKLEGDELLQFQQRVATDPSFAETVKLYSNINNEIWGDEDEQRLKQQLSQLNQKHFSQEGPARVIPMKRLRRTWYLVAAAAVIIAIVIFPLLTGSFKTADKLFAELITKDSLPGGTRGDNDQLRSAIASAYNNQRYAEALPLLEQFTTTHPDEASYNFAKAVCYAETNNSTAAMQQLDALIGGSSIYKYKAVAMKAQLFFKQDRKDKAAELLKSIPPEAPEYKKAQQLIKKMQ